MTERESRFDAVRREVGEALSSLPEPERTKALSAYATVRSELGEHEQRIAQLEGSIHALVNAAERLSRPGSQADEMVNAATMTNALMAAAKLVGNVGVFPEMGSS